MKEQLPGTFPSHILNGLALGQAASFAMKLHLGDQVKLVRHRRGIVRLMRPSGVELG
jgi:hypothetical protein